MSVSTEGKKTSWSIRLEISQSSKCPNKLFENSNYIKFLIRISNEINLNSNYPVLRINQARIKESRLYFTSYI